MLKKFFVLKDHPGTFKRGREAVPAAFEFITSY